MAGNKTNPSCKSLLTKENPKNRKMLIRHNRITNLLKFFEKLTGNQIFKFIAPMFGTWDNRFRDVACLIWEVGKTQSGVGKFYLDTLDEIKNMNCLTDLEKFLERDVCKKHIKDSHSDFKLYQSGILLSDDFDEEISLDDFDEVCLRFGKFSGDLKYHSPFVYADILKDL